MTGKSLAHQFAFSKKELDFRKGVLRRIRGMHAVILDIGAEILANGARSGFGGAAAQDVAGQFDALLASPGTLGLWHGLFMLIVTVILARGIQAGIDVLALPIRVALEVKGDLARQMGELAAAKAEAKRKADHQSAGE